jgi:hypothetical protein
MNLSENPVHGHEDTRSVQFTSETFQSTTDNAHIVRTKFAVREIRTNDSETVTVLLSPEEGSAEKQTLEIVQNGSRNEITLCVSVEDNFFAEGRTYYVDFIQDHLDKP